MYAYLYLYHFDMYKFYLRTLSTQPAHFKPPCWPHKGMLAGMKTKAGWYQIQKWKQLRLKAYISSE